MAFFKRFLSSRGGSNWVEDDREVDDDGDAKPVEEDLSLVYQLDDGSLQRDLTEIISNNDSSNNSKPFTFSTCKFPNGKLSKIEKQWISFCIEKLKKVKGIDKTLHESISQNCVLTDRFKYQFFNTVMEMDRNNLESSSTKALLKISLIFKETDQFGIFHTALIIGNWYLEWNDKGLAIVRRKKSEIAVFSLGLAVFVKEEDIHRVFNTIAQVCCEWNGTRNYDFKQTNSQHFIQSILEAIGIDLDSKLKGGSKLYFNNLKENGIGDMTIYLVDQLKPLFNNSNSVTFHTHAELDQFYFTVKETFSGYFDNEGKVDEILLKCFDRAFWIRRESSNTLLTDDEPLRVGVDDDSCHCPFNHYGDTYQNYMNLKIEHFRRVAALGNYFTNIPQR